MKSFIPIFLANNLDFPRSYGPEIICPVDVETACQLKSCSLNVSNKLYCLEMSYVFIEILFDILSRKVLLF